MVKLYVKKIAEGAVNPATGKAWKIEDVPERWREDVREALENNISDDESLGRGLTEDYNVRKNNL